jgi:NTE family protein
METDFTQFTDGSKWLGSKLWNLLLHNGIYKGDFFYHYMKDILAAKNIHTFKDLRYDDRNDKYAYRLKVMTSDITSQSLVVLPQDISDYGMNPDDLEVALAVRMSMSIPFFFRPIILDVKTGEETHMIKPAVVKHAFVDGGVLSNFPLWTWDSSDEPAWPTFGCMLFDKGEDKPKKTTNPINLATAMFGTMMKAHDKQFIRPDDFINRTISISTGSVSSIDFGISQQRKGILYKTGYDSATEFLKDWTWARYKRWAVNSRLRGL